MNLHIEMISGVAGDMLVASLLHLFPASSNSQESQRSKTINWLTSNLATIIPEESVVLNTNTVSPGGLDSLQIDFVTPEDDWHVQKQDDNDKHTNDANHTHTQESTHKHHHEHHQGSTHQHSHHHTHHRNFSIIKKMIEESQFTQWVKEKSILAFKILAQAEGAVHGVPFETVHFHEVGSLDAIYEVCGFFLLAEKLGIKSFSATDVVVGTGTVRCAHGLMPVPVPAVLNMIKNHNVAYKKISWETGELTTPTGLAILIGAGTVFYNPTSYFSTEQAKVVNIGYGAGHKSIPRLVNIVRVTLQDGTQNNSILPNSQKVKGFLTDEVVEIKVNIDDMNGEELAYLVDRLFQRGALDVVQYPVLMKKGRHGVVLEVLCSPNQFKNLSEVILLESSSLGIRYQYKSRIILPRNEESIEYKGFKFKVKLAGGKYKFEDDSLRAGLEQINIKNSSLLTRKELLHILEQKLLEKLELGT